MKTSVEPGLLTVRRSILINASPARVWKEFETFDRMKSWWGTGHQLAAYEPHIGGRMEMTVEVEGEPRRYGGRITVFDAARELTIENDWIPPREWPVPTWLTLRLTPLNGGTLVELFHHGFERLGDIAGEQLRGYESGWTMRQLERLLSVVEG
jgi:uncharacterized protein YndB with AHSA1/START domain